MSIFREDTFSLFKKVQVHASGLVGCRVAELGSILSGAKMAVKIFVKHVFTIFATNALFLRIIANLQIQLSKICNIYNVIVHFLSKKHCF